MNEALSGPTYLARARLAEAQGEHGKAREYYRLFLQRYDAPVPSHAHLVKEARAALARLGTDGSFPYLLSPANMTHHLAAHLGDALRGRYTLERELGRGGMATVYLAEDLKLHRPVALKVLRPELAASLGTERFLREIEIAARLQHPHILQLHDSGEAAGRLFYTMPFVEGESLRQRLEREGQLPIAEVIAIVQAVASALTYAHQQGIIHRDIKPENILICPRRKRAGLLIPWSPISASPGLSMPPGLSDPLDL